MAKSLVDKYEQILAQDPTSTAFVELAKALIEKEEHARAVDVCKQGLAHHSGSVLARVLWGKALISLGRPAEAMEQFDQAIAINRENPHAYNLISEVLLQKRLYRSALPLLRKAVALQPNDGRLRSWLEQTQAALNGGPSPILTPAQEDSFSANGTGEPSPHPPDGASIAAHGPVNGEETRPPLPFKPAARTGGTGLLADLPEEEPVEPVEAPKPVIATHAVEAIARDYETQLRAKLAETVEKKKKSFVARHWVKIAGATVATVALGAAGLIYLRTVSVNRGSLPDVLAEAKKSILLDTREGYAAALEALGRAVSMDDEVPEAWALSAYARALAFAEHGGNEADRAEARAALAKPKVREEFRAIAVASDWYLTDPAARGERDKELLAAQDKDAELNEVAGRILLARKEPKAALQRFQAALLDQPTNVRVLVALGDYYRSSGDFKKAVEFYSTAEGVSRAHPLRVLGMAESQLELGTDLPSAVAAVEALSEGGLSEDLKARRALLHGMLLTASGDGAKAAEALAKGATQFPSRALDFQLALGNAQRRCGRMAEAQRSFEAALSLLPSSEEAREALGRVLIDRDRPQEAVARVPADPRSRKISLMRGVAFSRIQDWKQARAEFERTQVKGRFPSEAVTHLAIADAAQGERARALVLLEKTLALTKKARSEILVAIGEIHLSKGELEKAKGRFAQAAKDPDDVEGACAHGRLLLRTGAAEAALEPLRRAAALNDSHLEAHEALARAYVQLGKTTEALETVTAVEPNAGASASLERTRALALYLSGRLDEAAQSANRAIQLEGKRAEGWRILAEVEFARADGRSGMKSLERANKLDPKDPETFCAIARAFLRQGNSGNAEKAYQAALALQSGIPCARVGLIYARLAAAGKPALKELDEAGAAATTVWDRAFAHAVRARVLLSLGQLQEAREAADEAVRIGAWSSHAHLALGLVAAKQKDTALATDALSRAVAADPVDGSARLALADLLSRGPDEEQAKALEHYHAFLLIGGEKDDENRVERTANALKKRLAAR